MHTTLTLKVHQYSIKRTHLTSEFIGNTHLSKGLILLTFFFFNPTITFFGSLMLTSMLWGYRDTEARSPSWRNSIQGAIPANIVLIKCGERF